MRQLFILLLTCLYISATAQFKADNIKYKTVFPQDLCKTLQANAGYTILDVRSDGEYNDTLSGSPSLNIGHMKNSLHINITELPNRWKELLPYKDKPLFVYCSHSQRSRRASRLLSDSGFTKIFNINGGLTDFYYESTEIDPCSDFTVTTSLPYKIISAKQLTENIGNKADYYIIDIRNDSIFKGITSDQRSKTEGYFEAAVNIPFSKFKTMGSFNFPSKPILLVDEYGDESPLAAKILIDKGFKNINILFGGMNDWIRYIVSTNGNATVKWKPGDGYNNLLSPEKFDRIAKNESSVIIDIRSSDEFNNKSKNYWQNLGQVKNAVNIPATEFENNLSALPGSKNKMIILYAFNNQPELYNVAEKLKEKGYKNVHILYGGIWNLRWASHNLKGKAQLNDWVINIPPENE